LIQKLSIIIPVYNEERTIEVVLKKILNLKLLHGIDKEVIVINDFSSDQSQNKIERFIEENKTGIRLINHEINRGKGAALKLGIKEAKGDFLIPQDADLELNPEDINRLIDQAWNQKLDVVYGNRFHPGNRIRKNPAYYANQLLSALSRYKTGLALSDMECCYKLIRTSIARQLALVENRFGFEPEITAKLGKIKGLKIGEVPIAYHNRNYQEGKKIGWKDGFRALSCILRY